MDEDFKYFSKNLGELKKLRALIDDLGGIAELFLGRYLKEKNCDLEEFKKSMDDLICKIENEK